MQKKFDFGKAGMFISILGGIMSIIGGFFSEKDAKQTAIETAHDTAIEYLTAATQEKSEEN